MDTEGIDVSSSDVQADNVQAIKQISLKLRAGYLTAGVGIGGAWAVDSGESPWLMLLKVALLIVVLRVVISVLEALRTRRRGPVDKHMHISGLIVAKVCLLGGAFILTEILRAADVSAAAYIVAALIVVVVTLVGPPMHSRLVKFGESA